MCAEEDNIRGCHLHVMSAFNYASNFETAIRRPREMTITLGIEKIKT